MKPRYPIKLSARESAINLLSRRDHSRYELTQKLLNKGYDSDEVELAVTYCAEHGYLDDLRYAKSQIRQHVTKGHGKLRIFQALKQQRVSDMEIEFAFDEEAIDWFELAKQVALKKFKGEPAEDQKMYAKQIRFMQYRGFDFEQISYALENK